MGFLHLHGSVSPPHPKLSATNRMMTGPRVAHLLGAGPHARLSASTWTARLIGALLNGVKDRFYLVLNDNAEHRGSVAWLSLQHHFDSSSRAALTTQLNNFLAGSYQPEQHVDFE